MLGPRSGVTLHDAYVTLCLLLQGVRLLAGIQNRRRQARVVCYAPGVRLIHRLSSTVRGACVSVKKSVSVCQIEIINVTYWDYLWG